MTSDQTNALLNGDQPNENGSCKTTTSCCPTCKQPSSTPDTDDKFTQTSGKQVESCIKRIWRELRTRCQQMRFDKIARDDVDQELGLSKKNGKVSPIVPERSELKMKDIWLFSCSFAVIMFSYMLILGQLNIYFKEGADNKEIIVWLIFVILTSIIALMLFGGWLYVLRRTLNSKRMPTKAGNASDQRSESHRPFIIEIFGCSMIVFFLISYPILLTMHLCDYFSGAKDNKGKPFEINYFIIIAAPSVTCYCIFALRRKIRHHRQNIFA